MFWDYLTFSTVDPCQEKDETLVKENSVTVTIHENTNDQIVNGKIVGIQAHKEETDEMEMMPMLWPKLCCNWMKYILKVYE